MKTLLREMVSGNKFRYKDDYYNLDLTYITPRIIAMSLPAEGIISSTYRNELSEVAQFLHEHHSENYLVINLSMKKYSYDKFKGKVGAESPRFWSMTGWITIPHTCRSSSRPASRCTSSLRVGAPDAGNKENIVVVHCMAGKGRTGSLISSYMIYVGAFLDRFPAIAYYKEKR